MDRYQYQNLNRGDIRLLRFCSTDKDGLSFVIQHKPFDENIPLFAALSYTWGENPTFPHRLRIGNTCLPITENLRDALVHVGRRIASKSNLRNKISWIWVDAICIDQSNNDEKSHQIGLMSDLYIRASKIYVWLGMPKDENSVRLAMEKLKYFYNRYISAKKGAVSLRPFWWPYKRRRRIELFTILGKLDPNDTKVFDVEGSDTHKAWLGIVDLWQQDWWKRAWILQESTVKEDDNVFFVGLGIWPVWASAPKLKVHFLCGQYSTHWMPIILSMLVADHLQKMPLLNTDFLQGAQGAARKVFSLRAQRQLPNKPEFLELLQQFRHSECKNPRDKVYSLLGLAPDSVRVKITPDYEKTVIEVYLDVVSRSLGQLTPDLDFLGYAMKLSSPRRAISKEISHETWPSWIPNWDDPLPLYPIPKVLYTRDTKQPRSVLLFNMRPPWPPKIALGKSFNASLNSRVDASISNHQLNISGIRIDEIVDLFSYQSMSWDERRAKLTDWKKKLGNKYPTKETFDEALARVQVADLQYSDDGYAMARNNVVNNALLGKPRAGLTPEEFKAQGQMRTALSFTTSFRGICLTKKGYVGMVPWSARKGDRICSLLGGQVLYVLRAREGVQQGNEHEYIGECYAHGLMDGEVMSWVEHGKAVIEGFTLI
jgi:Heterokaryon incompatibility protein (HET)